MDKRKNYDDLQKEMMTENANDTASDYILSTQKHLVEDKSRLPDYGDGFDSQAVTENTNDAGSDDYILSTQKHFVEDKSRLSDYGDDFDSQTGEDNSGYAYSLDKDIYSNSLLSQKKKNKKKVRASKVCAIVFIVLAIVCLVIAIVFVLTRCTDDKPIISQNTTASVTTVPIITNGTVYQIEPTQYQPQTEMPESSVQQPETTDLVESKEPESTDSSNLESSAPSEPVTEAESEFVPLHPESDPEESLDGDYQNAMG